MKRMLLVAALLLSLPICASAQEQGTRDVFAVVVTRHGVRSISKAPAQYTWEDWQPVPPSYLTARGYSLMTYMGAFYRLYFSSHGIPVSCGAPNAFVYADIDQRTLLTGRALLEGMCGRSSTIPLFHAAARAAAFEDPLFNGASWAASEHRIDANASKAAVLAAAGGAPDTIVQRYAADFASLQATLSQRCMGTCAPVTSETARLIAGDEGLSEVGGPLKTASSYAEDLFLQYAQCDPGSPPAMQIASAMKLHVLAYDVNSRNRYNARVRGGTLFAHIVAMLEEKAGEPHAQAQSPDISRDDIAIFSGHDTQLGALGGILNAHWNLSGGLVQDDMPPGGALVFELYRAGSEYRVRTTFAYETMQQFHHYKLLPHGIATAPVRIDGCSGRDCSVPLARFTQIANALVKDGFVRREWTNDTSAPVALDTLRNPKWTQCSP